MNQLGKVNELIIKPDLSELTEGKEDKDVVEQTADKESGSKADTVFTATSLETALNQVIRKRTNYEELFHRMPFDFFPYPIVVSNILFALP